MVRTREMVRRAQSAVALLAFFGVATYAQSLRGVVTDPSGAVTPGATITLAGPVNATATTGADGTYSFGALPAGAYTVRVSAPGLALAKPLRLTLRDGAQTLNLRIDLAARSDQITVQAAAGSTLTLDPAGNAGSLSIRGAGLDALGDSPDDLENDLRALAGPSAGPSGGAIFIDGFSGGQLPSKDAIREVRINQNPFSPEFETIGLGRIEILTKPGADKYRGSVFYYFATDAWNSRNPYASKKAPFLLKEYGGNLSGPVGRRASFFLDTRRDATDNGSIINAVIVDPSTLAVRPFDDVFRVPQRAFRLSPRTDVQLGKNHTLTGRYAYYGATIPGAGVGSFNLADRAYDLDTRFQTIQLSETAVLGPATINEIRFQKHWVRATNTARGTGPAIQVLDAFNAGAAPVGRAGDDLDNYELTDVVTLTRGPHTWRLGGRLRHERYHSISPLNFAGTFTFGGDGLQSTERYRRTLLYTRQGLDPAEIRRLGGGASQFSIVTGDPRLAATQLDTGVFAGDDWRVRANVTLSLGLRYEAQTNIGDWRAFGPRAGIAWAPGAKAGKPTTVIRAGSGVFYDRFALSNTVTARRYDGQRQRRYVVDNPDSFPTLPDFEGNGSPAIVNRVASDLRAPYIIQSALTIERQLPRSTTASLTFANSRGVHMFRSRVLPGPVFLMESSGIYNQNQLILNANTNASKRVSLTGFYALNRARSDTDGLFTFPANPASLAGEYGPAATDVRHRGSISGTLAAPWDIRLNPFVILSSGPPFDITAGRDIFGTTLFNARPALAADPSKPGVIPTAYGLLDPNPPAGAQFLPRNYGRGPGSILVNLRIAKILAFGKREPGSTARPYNLSIAMQIRNVINHNNPGAIIGNIASPLFGRANQAAGSRDLGGGGFSEAANNRRLELQTRFTF